MNALSIGRGLSPVHGDDKPTDLQVRVLRSKLITLTLDWELAALTLDAQRYKANASGERESLRDSANTYRKCVSELTELLSASSPAACQTD